MQDENELYRETGSLLGIPASQTALMDNAVIPHQLPGVRIRVARTHSLLALAEFAMQALGGRLTIDKTLDSHFLNDSFHPLDKSPL